MKRLLLLATAIFLSTGNFLQPNIAIAVAAWLTSRANL